MITAGCLGKIAYQTFAEAEGAKRRIMQRRDDGQKMRSYHCHKCGGFHLGRWRRDGEIGPKRTADHHAGSFKNRQQKYRQLTEGK